MIRKFVLVKSNINVGDSLVEKIQLLMKYHGGCLVELFEIQIAIVVSVQAAERSEINHIREQLKKIQR